MPVPLYWRVFYPLPRAEKKYEHRLQERQFEVSLPTRVAVRQWKDRKKKVVEPLFPNYIFARIDERGRLYILRTKGIVRCVAFGRDPAIVSEEEIHQLRVMQKSGACVEPVWGPFPEMGTAVVIEKGILRVLKDGSLLAASVCIWSSAYNRLSKASARSCQQGRSAWHNLDFERFQGHSYLTYRSIIRRDARAIP